MKKLTLIAGAAAGYVLGARAGRERYEQIKDAAAKARRNPRVQSVVDDAKAEATAAARQATETVKDKVTDAVKRDSSTDTTTPASRPVAGEAEVPLPGSTS